MVTSLINAHIRSSYFIKKKEEADGDGGEASTGCSEERSCFKLASSRRATGDINTFLDLYMLREKNNNTKLPSLALVCCK